MRRLFAGLKKAGRRFAGNPLGEGGTPDFFKAKQSTGGGHGPSGAQKELAIQLVPDRFYFLLFGAIRHRLQEVASTNARLLVVRAVSGAIGTGPVAELKRSALMALLFSRPWIGAYKGLVEGVAYRSTSYTHPLQDCKDWIASKALWQQIQGKEERFSLCVDGIEVADLLVDSYLRFKPSPSFLASDPFVRRLIWQALRDVRRANHYFKKSRPSGYISSYSTYLEHGIAVRVALQHQVPVWTFGSFNQFGKRLSSSDSYHTPDFSQYRSRFEALEDKGQRLQAARVMLDARLSGGIDAATSYMRQSAYGKTDAVLPQGLEGAVVVFLHDFYDSPHVYPDLIFQDFWRWICFTIETLAQAGTHFFLKPHPNQIALSDAVLSALRLKYPKLVWIDSGVSNVQLVQSGIVCGVTAYGTVAHELAYLGVPCIGCARHPHHAFDFCRTAKSQNEYAAMLRTFDVLPIDRAEMQQQALAFFYMHNLYGTSEQLELRSAYAELWKLCNNKATPASDILNALDALIRLPALEEFVLSMSTEHMRTVS